MDKLSAMRTYRRIVELGSFRAAATDRGLSTAGVSKQLAELENDLGASLLTRTTRRLATTEAGQAYYERCARILDDIAETEAAVTASQAAPRGLLRVTAPMSFGLLHLMPLVPAFMRGHPEVKLDLVLNDRAVDLIEEGFDVALRIRTSLADSSLVAKRLGPVTRVLCASPDYVAGHGAPERPADLARHRCLVYSLSEAPTEWTLAPPGGAGPVTVRVEPALTVNSSMGLREALLAGVGLSLIPGFVVWADLEAGALVPLLPDHAATGHALHAVYPHSRHLSPKVRAFVDFVAAAYAGKGVWSG